MRIFFVSMVFVALYCGALCAEDPGGQTRPNVLFIAVDDLRPELGCYGVEDIITPNLDRLAAEGLLFNRAYCQVPICMPSRASTLSGYRPESIGNAGQVLNAVPPGSATLPQLFRNHGYRTVATGKVYHANYDDPAGWVKRYTDTFTEPEPAGGSQYGADGFVSGYQHQENPLLLVKNYFQSFADKGISPLPPSFEISETDDEVHPDAIIAQRAIEELQRAKKTGEPFFLAAGFYRPHLPFVAPKKYWDLYDRSTLSLPANIEPVQDGIKRYNWEEFRLYSDIPDEGPMSEAKAREMIHGYYASVSFVDAQIGKVLDELKRLGLDRNTIVVLWGDNGFSLSEHGLWGKNTNYETSARVAMMISAPGMPKGDRTQALVELVDIYPTLAELCALPLPGHLEGTSFVPVMRQPARAWKTAAFSHLLNGSRTIRTDQFRLIVHPEGQLELYDHRTGPAEDKNLAADPAHGETLKTQRAALEAGWKAALPASGDLR